MVLESSVIVAVAAGLGLVVGAGLTSFLRSRAGRADRERAEQLESELEQTREELETHREDVARHFEQTSDLFRDMTEQYTRLYAHLATGARAFHTGEVPALGQLDRTLIGEDAPDVAGSEDSDAQPAAETAAPHSRSNGKEAAAATS